MTTTGSPFEERNGAAPSSRSRAGTSAAEGARAQVEADRLAVDSRLNDLDDQLRQTQQHALAMQQLLTELIGDVDTSFGQVDRRLQLLELGASARDIDAEAQRQAVASSALFVEEHLRGTRHFRDKGALLGWTVDQAPREGLALEFGVATGTTLRQIVAKRPHAHGFDSFAGLPEDWRPGFTSGRFAQVVPDVSGAELHIGLFEDTLPTFLAEHHEPWAFVHLDADLYSSTSTVLRLAGDRLVSGTVLLFDEYFNYPGWQHHEHKALLEFVQSGRAVRYLAYNGADEQVAVQVI